MDGVLVDTAGLQDETFNAALRACGYTKQWSPAHGEEALSSVEKLTRLGIPAAEHRRVKDQKLLEFWNVTHRIRYDPHLKAWLWRAKRLFPGGLALVTSMRHEMLSNILQMIEVPYNTWDAVVTQESVGALYVKPHPRPYQLAAAMLCVHPSDCEVYEDSDTGVESATAAGCGRVHKTTYDDFMRRLIQCEF
jgi:sugar-phosphatase